MNWLFNLFYQILSDRTFGRARNPAWGAFRKVNIKKACEVCGTKWFLELHHVEPVHVFPKLELEPDNCVTLCRKHHLEFGHLFSFRSYNSDIKEWILKVKQRP